MYTTSRSAEERERAYAERVSARVRNLDLGAALARWEPKLDTDAVKLLGSLVLLHYGKAAAWAHRLCVDQPTTTNKQGKATVRYPRGAQAEKQAHEAALAALMRTARPRRPSRSSCACSSRSVSLTRPDYPEPTGRGSTSRRSFPARRCSTSSPGGLRRSRSSSGSRQSRPSGNKREKAWRAEQAARIEEQRAKLAAGEAVRCECCLRMIESAERRRREGRNARPRRRLRAAMGQRRRRAGGQPDGSGGPRRRSMNSTVRPTYYA